MNLFQKHSIINFFYNDNYSDEYSMELNVSNHLTRYNLYFDVLKLDFDSAVVQILKCNSQIIQGIYDNIPGVVKSNKGISCDRLFFIY